VIVKSTFTNFKNDANIKLKENYEPSLQTPISLNYHYPLSSYKDKTLLQTIIISTSSRENNTKSFKPWLFSQHGFLRNFIKSREKEQFLESSNLIQKDSRKRKLNSQFQCFIKANRSWNHFEEKLLTRSRPTLNCSVGIQWNTWTYKKSQTLI